ncbi:MAG: tetratricopeptide repeat protein, partial [Deltaproteobacteria bacterium]|nr:tetratricopeptide repeat protein [Deltaproteobacteria bacterium]
MSRAEGVATKLIGYEAEARQLGTDLPHPNQPDVANAPRKLVDAIVAFRLGDYDTAALALFDLVGTKGAISASETEQATYYLAETLFQKGDRGASRTYFTQVTVTNGKYTLPSLLRLVEISIVQKDDATELLAAIDRTSPSARTPSVPYVRGKHAFANGKFDEAMTYFNDVPKGSELELQAMYYVGATSVAKKDLQKANDVFTDLIGRKPRSANDRRVVELSQLALGRLYYERDQFSKSIDSYLLVDRRSDLFPDALYEVAWVYVKNKQFDKALRALELLALSDPQSTKTPTVRLLEGNLRIRKAQMLRDAQIIGTIDPTNTETPDTEYDKASAVFAETHEAYYPSYRSLAQMVDSKSDPTQYIMQIAGRQSKVFQATMPIPEAAAQWLREEPEVQRFVAVEADLGQVQTDLDASELLITRLENVVGTNDKTAVYPQLASRRSRIGQIQDDLIKVRTDLADQALRLVDSNGELSGLSGTRKTLVAQYANLGDAEKAYADRISTTHQDYEKLDQSAAEVSVEIDATQAVAV